MICTVMEACKDVHFQTVLVQAALLHILSIPASGYINIGTFINKIAHGMQGHFSKVPMPLFVAENNGVHTAYFPAVSFLLPICAFQKSWAWSWVFVHKQYPRRAIGLIWLNQCVCAEESVTQVHANRAHICSPFKEPRNRFPACRAVTTTLFVVPANRAMHRRADRFLGIDSWAP